MASTTSVQVDRLALIKELKKRVVEIPAANEKHDKAMEAYKKAVKTWAIKVVKDSKNITDATENYRDNQLTVEITDKAVASKPVKPEAPAIGGEYNVKCAVENIQQVIRVLELSNSETVGTSITNKIAQYL